MICSDLDQKLCVYDHCTVEWLETDSRLGKSISRSTVGMWTDPIGIWSIGENFKKITIIAAIIDFVTTSGPFCLNFVKSLISD